MHVSEEARGRFLQRWVLSSGPALTLLACCTMGANLASFLRMKAVRVCGLEKWDSWSQTDD